MASESKVEAEHTANDGLALEGLAATADIERIEAPVTWKAYLMCAFAALGGIFYGYDTGYISNVNAMNVWINVIEGPNATELKSSTESLIVSIMSVGTFLGALAAGDVADFMGRKWTVIMACGIFAIGVVIEIITGDGDAYAEIVIGRLIAGLGTGFESATVILYMSEICPRKVRGALVAGYQFCITIGLLVAACITYSTSDWTSRAAYRLPIGIQFIWAVILGTGILFLPDSPRWFVKRGNLAKARHALSALRGQPEESEFVQYELAEIVANEEYEKRLIPSTTWFGSWAACFSGSLWKSNSNLRKTILGTSLQMMQQWTGVNFIFYYGTPFLKSTGAVSNEFLLSVIFNVVNTLATPFAFWGVESWGRRPMLLWGALSMLICQLIVAVVGVTVGFNHTHADPSVVGGTAADNPAAVKAQIAFIAIFIFSFATTWGPGAWIVIGEIFPLPIRSRGVALSTASNWLWNLIIAIITPYMVDALVSSVFFIWFALCTCAFVYTYFLVPETKGLSLEQVDLMMEETTPRNSAKWRPTKTFAGAHARGNLRISQLQ
ncbi:general substrate transporter [Cryphonectria parasitica EP155]|uniref:General substrate transporter n=1 Tax=Cryphonectria parasitica (strain ATCC 38755 / EP155) TaxID=660469 RepID=A0A9P4Y566_CRYP1|nr:general substrate transporter [Cryphonectria parasitica EP155]KAF3766903.1 general substrate transporter [Cryphonectria parasitica EP155]